MQQQNIFQSLQDFKNQCDQARQIGDNAALLKLKKQGVKLPSACRFLRWSFYWCLKSGGIIWRMASKNPYRAMEAWYWVERQKSFYNGQNPPVLSRNEF